MSNERQGHGFWTGFGVFLLVSIHLFLICGIGYWIYVERGGQVVSTLQDVQNIKKQLDAIQEIVNIQNTPEVLANAKLVAEQISALSTSITKIQADMMSAEQYAVGMRDAAEKARKDTADSAEGGATIGEKVEAEEREKAIAKAVALEEAGQLSVATYYIGNALQRKPGDQEIIQRYHDLLEKMAREEESAGKIGEAAETYGKLETFLRGQITFVTTDTLDTLLSKIASVSEKRQALEKTEVVASEKEAVDTQISPEIDVLYSKLVAGSLEQTVSENPEEARIALDTMNSLREYSLQKLPEGSDQQTLSSFGQYVDSLQNAVAFDKLMADCISSIDAIADEGNPTLAAYEAQICEGGVRQLISLRRAVSETRQGKLQEIVSRLENQSRNVNERARNEKAKDIWTKFKENPDTLVLTTSVEEWKQNTAAIGIINPMAENTCQKQIERVISITQKLEQVLPELMSTDCAGEARKTLEYLSSKLTQARVAQQQNYQAWAMVMIQKCLKESLPFEHTIGTDSSAIGKNILTYLGSIDRNCLTSEVNRCFSEVFDKLFADLYKPKSDTDFSNDEGYQLSLLKSLQDSNKATLQQF